MLCMKRSILLGAVLFSLLFVAFTGIVWADTISPSQEQEYVDARGALDAARKAEGEKLSPSYIRQAEDFLKIAGGARSIPDAEGFSRASRLARANADTAILATTQEALLKAKAEIERLKK
jgi:hypothetical protein